MQYNADTHAHTLTHKLFRQYILLTLHFKWFYEINSTLVTFNCYAKKIRDAFFFFIRSQCDFILSPFRLNIICMFTISYCCHYCPLLLLLLLILRIILLNKHTHIHKVTHSEVFNALHNPCVCVCVCMYLNVPIIACGYVMVLNTNVADAMCM